MTPDQLLGLQSYARAKTLSPEITVETGDAVPAVIASGTGETVPITIEPMMVDSARGSEPAFVPAPPIDDVIAELEAKFAPPPRPAVSEWFASANDLGAFVGFSLFGAWTLVEVAMLLAR